MTAELKHCVNDANTDTPSERDVFLASVPQSRITRVSVLADDTLAELIEVFSQEGYGSMTQDRERNLAYRGDKLIVSSDVDLEPQVPSYTFRVYVSVSDNNNTLTKIDEFTIGPTKQ